MAVLANVHDGRQTDDDDDGTSYRTSKYTQAAKEWHNVQEKYLRPVYMTTAVYCRITSQACLTRNKGTDQLIAYSLDINISQNLTYI